MADVDISMFAAPANYAAPSSATVAQPDISMFAPPQSQGGMATAASHGAWYGTKGIAQWLVGNGQTDSMNKNPAVNPLISPTGNVESNPWPDRANALQQNIDTQHATDATLKSQNPFSYGIGEAAPSLALLAAAPYTGLFPSLARLGVVGAGTVGGAIVGGAAPVATGETREGNATEGAIAGFGLSATPKVIGSTLKLGGAVAKLVPGMAPIVEHVTGGLADKVDAIKEAASNFLNPKSAWQRLMGSGESASPLPGAVPSRPMGTVDFPSTASPSTPAIPNNWNVSGAPRTYPTDTAAPVTPGTPSPVSSAPIASQGVPGLGIKTGPKFDSSGRLVGVQPIEPVTPAQAATPVVEPKPAASDFTALTRDNSIIGRDEGTQIKTPTPDDFEGMNDFLIRARLANDPYRLQHVYQILNDSPEFYR